MSRSFKEKRKQESKKLEYDPKIYNLGRHANLFLAHSYLAFDYRWICKKYLVIKISRYTPMGFLYGFEFCITSLPSLRSLLLRCSYKKKRYVKIGNDKIPGVAIYWINNEENYLIIIPGIKSFDFTLENFFILNKREAKDLYNYIYYTHFYKKEKSKILDGPNKLIIKDENSFPQVNFDFTYTYLDFLSTDLISYISNFLEREPKLEINVPENSIMDIELRRERATFKNKKETLSDVYDWSYNTCMIINWKAFTMGFYNDLKEIYKSDNARKMVIAEHFIIKKVYHVYFIWLNNRYDYFSYKEIRQILNIYDQLNEKLKTKIRTPLPFYFSDHSHSIPVSISNSTF